MKLRRLTDEGIRCFSDYLDSLPTETPREYPVQALMDEQLSEAVHPEVEVPESLAVSSRRELAETIDDIFSQVPELDPARDRGLLSWLSLLWFRDLCRKDRSRRYKPGARQRWIPSTNLEWRTYYRHELAGPYRIYKAHSDDVARAGALLNDEVGVQSEVVEQLASRQQFVTNKAVVGVATRLYVDPETGAYRRGAKGKGPGSPRRLADCLWQLDLTWDLYSMDEEELLTLLPAEFDRWEAAPPT